jgi:D-serine deaminase-like pyridoxal phosphate-dependent protein
VAGLHDVPTPALLLDAAVMRRNAARVGARVRGLGARLRPHVKTHKCVEVAEVQVAGHFEGITVSTLAEARAFAAEGFTDITYAVPVEPGKFDAARALLRQGVRLGLLTDDLAVPAALDAALAGEGTIADLWVKVDCGYHRCGVDPADPALPELVQRIGAARHLRFAGLLTHAGHAYHARGPDAVLAVARQERDVMREAAGALRTAGLPVPAVSVGSTPTATHVDHLEGVDEVRAGNYVFFDLTQVAIGSCTTADCALSVLASVVHRDRARGHVVLDAGAIALSKDLGPAGHGVDGPAGFGRVLDLEGRDLGLVVDGVSQEHGVVRVRDEAGFDRLPVGTRVRVLVNHSCLTAAQHDAYLVLDDGRIVDRWAIHRGW